MSFSMIRAADWPGVSLSSDWLVLTLSSDWLVLTLGELEPMSAPHESREWTERDGDLVSGDQ